MTRLLRTIGWISLAMCPLLLIAAAAVHTTKAEPVRYYTLGDDVEQFSVAFFGPRTLSEYHAHWIANLQTIKTGRGTMQRTSSSSDGAMEKSQVMSGTKISGSIERRHSQPADGASTNRWTPHLFTPLTCYFVYSEDGMVSAGRLLRHVTEKDGRIEAITTDSPVFLFQVMTIARLAFLSGLLGAGSLATRRAIRRSRRRAGRCVRCLYDLHGLTEPRCPECGTPFDAGALGQPRWASGMPRLRRAAIAMLVVGLGLASLTALVALRPAGVPSILAYGDLTPGEISSLHRMWSSIGRTMYLRRAPFLKRTVADPAVQPPVFGRKPPEPAIGTFAIRTDGAVSFGVAARRITSPPGRITMTTSGLAVIHMRELSLAIIAGVVLGFAAACLFIARRQPEPLDESQPSTA